MLMPPSVKTPHSSPPTNQQIGYQSVKHKAKRLTQAQRQANIAAKIEKFKVSGGVVEADEEDN